MHACVRSLHITSYQLYGKVQPLSQQLSNVITDLRAGARAAQLDGPPA